MSSSPSVLLDLDGTLIDSLPGILSSWQAALRVLGHQFDPTTDLTGLIGPPIEDSMRLLLERYGDDRVDEAVAAYRADYGKRGLFDSLPYAGVPQALAQMRSSGARLWLVTSKRTIFARRILEHFDLVPLFEGIYGSEPDGTFDHKPELIAHILQRHALAPGDCVMVGDRSYDITAAHAHRMRALGVLWGYGERSELEAAGADDLVAEPTDLAAAALAMTEG